MVFEEISQAMDRTIFKTSIWFIPGLILSIVSYCPEDKIGNDVGDIVQWVCSSQSLKA